MLLLCGVLGKAPNEVCPFSVLWSPSSGVFGVGDAR